MQANQILTIIRYPKVEGNTKSKRKQKEILLVVKDYGYLHVPKFTD